MTAATGPNSVASEAHLAAEFDLATAASATLRWRRLAAAAEVALAADGVSGAPGKAALLAGAVARALAPALGAGGALEAYVACNPAFPLDHVRLVSFVHAREPARRAACLALAARIAATSPAWTEMPPLLQLAVRLHLHRLRSPAAPFVPGVPAPGLVDMLLLQPDAAASAGAVLAALLVARALAGRAGVAGLAPLDGRLERLYYVSLVGALRRADPPAVARLVLAQPAAWPRTELEAAASDALARATQDELDFDDALLVEIAAERLERGP